MVSQAIHYLLYMAIAVCIVAPFVMVILLRRGGKVGIGPFFLGIAMCLSITVLQSGIVEMLKSADFGDAVFYLLYVLLYSLAEFAGFYFFMRVFLKDAARVRNMCAGAAFGGTTAWIYAFNIPLTAITMVIAVNGGNYDEVYAKALEMSEETAKSYAALHDFVLGIDALQIIGLVLYGAACVCFFTLLGSYMARALKGRNIYFLYSLFAVLIFEAPAILIGLTENGVSYSYLYQSIIGAVAAFMLSGEIKKTVGKRGTVEISPRLK